jgi:hypothetical protein
MAVEIASLASWSEWLAFADAVAQAPTCPGVYLARTGTGPVVYVGMAGERRGRGLRGRLAVYASGKAAVSGLGEAAFNRAVRDPGWIRDRLVDVEAGKRSTARSWARSAIDAADLYVSWACTADRTSALELERQALGLLAAEHLWNVRRPVAR